MVKDVMKQAQEVNSCDVKHMHVAIWIIGLMIALFGVTMGTSIVITMAILSPLKEASVKMEERTRQVEMRTAESAVWQKATLESIQRIEKRLERWDTTAAVKNPN